MKIRIEKAKCVGNARCHAVAEHLYPLDDDGYIASEGFDVPNGHAATAPRIMNVGAGMTALSQPPAPRAVPPSPAMRARDTGVASRHSR